MAEKTIPEMFFDQVRSLNQKPALRYKANGKWTDISWRDFGQQVRDLAAGLLELDIEPGDKVALISENRPEWAMVDIAAISIRAVNVPIYPTNIPPQVLHVLRDSEAKAVVVSNSAQLDKVLEVRDKAEHLETIIIIDVPDGGVPPGIISLEDLKKLGRRSGKKAVINQLIKDATPEEVVTFIYTSGTTGDPKGVMLTHRNFISNAEAMLKICTLGHDDVALSFLPLSHSFERTAGYYVILKSGGVIAYAESIDTLIDNIVEVKPTVMCSVPRVYEKVHAGVLENVSKSPALKRHIFEWALSIGREMSRRQLAKEYIPISLRATYQIAHNLVFKQIHGKLGGQLRFFVSGGAPLAKEIAEFFHSIGILILEGYGMTEASPCISGNRLDNFKFGTVGPPVPGVEVKIDQDGEILVKGPNVMKGYFKNEEATQQTIRDGWLCTGDIGYLDEDGHLRITDRKKDIIVTAGGKNIAPQNIENLLKLNKYIEQIGVIGDKRRYLSALIVPSFEKLGQYAKEHGIKYRSNRELIQNEEIIKLMQEAVNEGNGRLAKYENIVKFALIDKEFTQEAGELTPTLKLKRRIIEQKYKYLIDSMY